MRNRDARSQAELQFCLVFSINHFSAEFIKKTFTFESGCVGAFLSLLIFYRRRNLISVEMLIIINTLLLHIITHKKILIASKCTKTCMRSTSVFYRPLTP